MSHTSILRALQKFEGYPGISNWQLYNLRKCHGFSFRRKKVLEAEKILALNAVKAALENGVGSQWGIGYMQTYIRQTSDFFVSREQIWAILKELDPQGVLNRQLDAPRV